MFIALFIIGIVIGILSGFFGIGGGTVLVPSLMLLSFSFKDAVGISIMQMVFSSIYGSYLNIKSGSLKFEEGLFVGLGGFVGGYLSSIVSSFVSDFTLQIVFIGFVLFALIRMFLHQEYDEAKEVKELSKVLLFFIGLGIGLIAISIGVGGGIILIPLLSGVLHYPVKKAVSAGLFFVVFSSVSGMIGRLLHSQIDLIDGAILGVGSLIGVYIGVKLKEYIPSKSHKNFIVIMYSIILMIMVYKMFFR